MVINLFTKELYIFTCKYKYFSSCWEVRHGACIGLREILKVHGSGAGKVGM
jgi:TATA-binding protein-associated factor